MRVYHVNKFPATPMFFSVGGYLPRVMAAPKAPKTVLEYSLKAVENAAVLQITEQSSDITAFLKSNRYLASNGIIIAADQYPEFKDSNNHLYLRGKDTDRNLKLDVTRFVGAMQRDSKISMVKAALKEFVEFVAAKTKASYNPVYVW